MPMESLAIRVTFDIHPTIAELNRVVMDLHQPPWFRHPDVSLWLKRRFRFRWRRLDTAEGGRRFLLVHIGWLMATIRMGGSR